MTTVAVISFLISVAVSALGADPPLDNYVRIVQQKYQKLPDLNGWWTSSDVVANILNSGSSRVETTTLHNLPNQDLIRQIKQLSPPHRRSLVYLSGHVDRHGNFLDGVGNGIPLAELLHLLSNGLKPGVILVDTCYAAIGFPDPDKTMPGTLAVCAATKHEPTFSLDLVRKAPLHLKKRYPEAWQFVTRGKPNNGNGKVSYLGFSIVRALTAHDLDLSTKPGWQSLARAVTNDSGKKTFQQRGLGSTIVVYSGQSQ